MEGLALIYAINAAAIVAFYVVFGLVAGRYKKRIDNAAERLKDTTVEKTMHTQFSRLAGSSFTRAQAKICGISLATLVILFIGFSLYANLVEPGAQVGTWIFLQAIMYGPALIGGLVIMVFAVSRMIQVKKLNYFIDTAITSYPQSPILAEVKEMIRPRVGELGVSALSFTAMAGSVVLGVGFLVFFFMAAQTAIECARSSKCL